MIKKDNSLDNGMELRAPKGTRDLMPEDKIAKDKVIAMLKETFESFGFNPIETPGIEEYKTLTAKFAAGEGSDAIQEIFDLEDRAGRKLGLRFDLTVPLARVIATNSNIPKPFKRYAIGRVWRNGPIKLGRYREFLQCDADIIGVQDRIADAEIIALIDNFFSKLGFKYVIKFNNRKLLEGLLESSKVPKEKMQSVMIAIDKLSKIGEKGVKAELKEKGISTAVIKNILGVLNIVGEGLSGIGDIVKTQAAKEGYMELVELYEELENYGVKNAEFDIGLVRGLVYYTGTVFEVFMVDGDITSSLAAGGRWDEMISKFAVLKENVPAVGVSFGIDVILDALRLTKSVEFKKNVSKVFIIPIKTYKDSILLAQKLRKEGINTDLALAIRSISKNLEYANKQGVPFVILVGPKELEKKEVILKDMKKGTEKKVKIEALAKLLKK